MKTIITVLSVLIVTTSGWAERVNWEHNYDQALERAKKEKKLVMVDVYTDWCGWCKKLDKEVYKDKAVEDKLNKGFVAVKINPETGSKNAKLAKALGAHGYPYIVFFDADGNKLSEIRGYVPAASFLTHLEGVTDKSSK